VVAAVETATVGVVVVPLSVVDRDAHFWRIAVVQAVGTSVILVAPEVLRVVDIRVVVEAIPVLGRVGLTPCATVCLLSVGCVGLGQTTCERPGATGSQEDPADHRISPLEGLRVSVEPAQNMTVQTSDSNIEIGCRQSFG